MRIVVGVENLVQRIRNGRTGRILGDRTIERSGDAVCGLYRAQGLKSTVCQWFGLKTTGMVCQWFGLKAIVTVSPGFVSKSVATVYSGLASKSVVDGFCRFCLKTDTDGFSQFNLKTSGGRFLPVWPQNQWWKVFQFGHQN
jgi:hypothetical protein